MCADGMAILIPLGTQAYVRTSLGASSRRPSTPAPPAPRHPGLCLGESPPQLHSPLSVPSRSRTAGADLPSHWDTLRPRRRTLRRPQACPSPSWPSSHAARNRPPPRHGTQTSIPVLIQKAPQVPACLPAPSLHSGLSVLPSLALTHRAVCLRVSAPKVPSAGNAPPLCVPLSEFQWLSLWSSAQKLLPQATSSDPLKQVKSPVSAPHHPVFSFTVLPAPGRAVSAHARVAASPRAASVRPPPSAQWARSWYSANVCHTRGAAWA